MESIKEYFKKIKPYEGDLILAFVIILVAFLSFGLGRLSKMEESKVPITIENVGAGAISAFSNTDAKNIDVNNGEIPTGGTLVASKNGAKYHFPWCSGALRIKDENKIWFQSEKEAKKAGYGPAANCKGLK